MGLASPPSMPRRSAVTTAAVRRPHLEPHPAHHGRDAAANWWLTCWVRTSPSHEAPILATALVLRRACNGTRWSLQRGAHAVTRCEARHLTPAPSGSTSPIVWTLHRGRRCPVAGIRPHTVSRRWRARQRGLVPVLRVVPKSVAVVVVMNALLAMTKEAVDRTRAIRHSALRPASHRWGGSCPHRPAQVVYTLLSPPTAQASVSRLQSQGPDVVVGEAPHRRPQAQWPAIVMTGRGRRHWPISGNADVFEADVRASILSRLGQDARRPAGDGVPAPPAEGGVLGFPPLHGRQGPVRGTSRVHRTRPRATAPRFFCHYRSGSRRPGDDRRGHRNPH